VNSLTNIFQGLKNHAVTMFEVGKLSDESLDSLLLELEKVRSKGRIIRQDQRNEIVPVFSRVRERGQSVDTKIRK
jgi:ribosomal protein L39E